MKWLTLFVVLLAVTVALAENSAPFADVVDPDTTPNAISRSELSDAELLLGEQQEAVTGEHVAMSKTSRQHIRQETLEAVAELNIPFSFISEHEQKENESVSTGYQEMTRIFEKIKELETKLISENEKEVRALMVHRGECQATRKRIMDLINKLIRRQSELMVTNVSLTSKNDESALTISKSETTQAQFEVLVKKTMEERRLSDDGYHIRKAKRLKEMEILKKATALVCTFRSQKNLTSCRDFLKENVDLQPTKVGADHRPLNEVLKEADKVEGDLKKKWAEEKKAEGEGKKARESDEYDEMLIQMQETTTAKARRESMLGELEELLSTGDVRPVVYQPVRRLAMYIQMGKDTKSATLADLLLDLLNRIKVEQKRETLDWLEDMKRLDKRIADLRVSISEETKRQETETESIKRHKNTIALNITLHVEAGRSIAAERKAFEEDKERCRLFEVSWYDRKKGRDEEALNLDKLRSLLRSLQTSKIPKCKNDCTSAERGTCVWKGKYGKDSYCSCKEGFHGNICQFSLCPGLGGSMYKADHVNACSRHGTCDSTTGKCKCRDSYLHGTHNACENRKCPVNAGGVECGGQGKCDRTAGKCTCNSRTYGSACQYKRCPSGSPGIFLEATHADVCSGKGACVPATGMCSCRNPYFGVACERRRCPVANCNGRGKCDESKGVCKCDTGYWGHSCEYIRCPKNCNGRRGGKCDRRSGKCYCRMGRSGAACDLVGACGATVANWTLVFDKKGWASCPHGFLMTGMQRGNSNGLFDINFAACAQPCIGGKTVIPVEECKAENWWKTFDHKGWSRCRPNTYMQGLYRNTCNAIYCLEEARCCKIKNSFYHMCQDANWWSSFDRAGMSSVRRGNFMTGLYRTGDINSKENNLYNIEMAASCKFIDRSTLRA
jgi:hypothetical protein